MVGSKVEHGQCAAWKQKVIDVNWYVWQLMEISDVLRASCGFKIKNVLQTGTVAQLFGFDIMIRPVVSVFADGATSPKAYGAATATTDNLACIAFHTSTVRRTLGSMTPLYDAGSNGNGKPSI